MRCVILQPSYVPWRGYFDLIHKADVFVFYDDVQYDKGGWRNRNRIKTSSGPKWLTIPVRKHGAQTRRNPILAVETAHDDWAQAHRATITQSYAKAPYFAKYRRWLDDTYSVPVQKLAEFTIRTTIDLAGMIGASSTQFLRSSELRVEGGKTDRLVSILRDVGATEYLSGPSAKDYIEADKFADAGITLSWMAYDYPEYPQLYPPFDPYVSVLDLLFMTGDNAGSYIWGTPPA